MNESIRNVFTGRVLTLNLEQVRLPNGRVAELEIAHHPGGAAVVAPTMPTAGCACCGSTGTPPAAGWTSCRPASSTAASRRSSARSANSPRRPASSARRWDKLGEFFSSPGVLTEVIHLFLARDLAPADARPEEHEVFEARWIPFDEAVDLAARGELRDAKSLIGLLWARERLRAG
jgi:hypothetical protein